MLPLRRRILPVVGVLIGAPITAEYLYAYLSFTGDLGMSLLAIAFFAPLYGGVALLIREVAVRTGLGWSGVLLLGAGFGFAMPGVIDLALLGEARDDVAFWAEMREPTLISRLGVSGFPALSWTLGHVMMSVGAPLAVLHALAAPHRGRPLLGKAGISVTSLAAALAIVMAHQDGRETYGYAPSLSQFVAVLAVVAVFVALAFTRLGAPVITSEPTRTIPALTVLLGAVILKLSTDLLPPTWAGVAVLIAVILLAGTLLRWSARHRRWGPRQIGLLGVGVIFGGILTGFASPVPGDVSVAAKVVHSGVLLLLGIVVLVVVVRSTRETGPHSSMVA